ncbi:MULTISPECIES: hypothetical protein [unclassified Kitasatospora]|uniref:hypothetical protein n=1 Tax=unclassified Kitasatospora TaxID=2633591 RepID=UPI0037F90FF3
MMHPVEYYPDGHPGLDWHAVSDDLDGVVLAESPRGVALARATDRRRVLFFSPDEWADLRHAIKQGRCDHLLGDRLLCADPTPLPPDPPDPPGSRHPGPVSSGRSVPPPSPE